MDTTAVTGLAAIGGKFTIVVILAGFIMAFFIRVEVGEPKATKAQPAA